MNKILIKRLLSDNDMANGMYDKIRNRSMPYHNKRIFISPFQFYITSKDYGFPHDEDIKENHCDIDIIHLVEVSHNPESDGYFPIEVDKNALECFYKENKNGCFKIKTNDFIIGFNAKFLKNLLEAYKTNTIFIKNPISPCYTSNNINDDFGMLLPIRCEQE